MSIIICSTRHDGCGYVGFPETFIWHGRKEGSVVCPKCFEDHAFQITEENIDSVTDESNYELVRSLLNIEECKKLEGSFGGP